MSNEIEVEIKLDDKFEKTKVIIYTANITEELNKLVNKIKSNNESTLIGYKDDEAFLLELEKIESIYTENKKIYARSDKNIYLIKKRIFELEDLLEEDGFVRISNSEIVNFKKVLSIDFKIVGTILLNFKSGEKTYVSRRYVKKIKEYLGV